jgi:bifunctional non-homologous end joining protein LigD
MFVFDVLAVDGVATIAETYLDRRARLDGLGLAHPRVQVPPFWSAGIDGATLLEVARRHGLEGVVAKRASSRYQPGRRSSDWIKTPLRDTLDVLIGAWIPLTGQTELGALLVGAYDAGGSLIYLGHVGTGFNAATRRQLRDRLTELAARTSPFARPVPPADAHGAHYVQPLLVAIVEYRELTSTAHLRHPSFKGLRTDRDPDTVTVPD